MGTKIEIEIEVMESVTDVFEEDCRETEENYEIEIERLGDGPNGHPMFAVEGEKENVLEFLVQWYGMDEQEAKEIYPDLA